MASQTWGLKFDLADLCDLGALTLALRDQTRLILFEAAVTNPPLRAIDIAGVVARRGRALVVVDNTFPTPYYRRPLEAGADLVVHSTTKYLNGHGDVIGGAVVTRSAELHERVRFVQKAAGAIPGPMDCYLIHRGVQTLPLRMRAHTDTGRWVHEFLTTQGVTELAWPGYTGMISFRHPAAVGIAGATKLWKLAVSLGDPVSLICVPAHMTHGELKDTPAAVPEDLLRLSCGAEDPEDLIEDLGQAIHRATGR